MSQFPYQPQPLEPTPVQPMPPGGGGKRLTAIVIAALFMVGLVAGAVIYLVKDRRKLPPRPPESAELKYAEVRQAFSGEPLPPGEVPAELKQTIERFSAAMRDGNGAAAAKCMDLGRMLDEVVRLGGIPPVPASQRSGMEAAMRRGMVPGLSQAKLLGMWHRPEIRGARLTPDGAEALVFLRHWSLDGYDSKHRVWLIRNGSEWLIYDMEDLGAGIRVSTLMAQIVPQAENIPSFGSQGPQIQRVSLLITQGEFEEASDALRELESQRLPDAFQGLLHFLRGTIHLGLEEHEEALAAMDRAVAVQPDLPMVHLVRATAYLALEKYDQCLEQVERYEQLLGEDYWALEMRGQVAANREQFDEACDYYRRSLVDNPNQPDVIVNLAYALPEDGMDEIGRHFAKLHSPGDSFIDIAEELCDQWLVGGVASLVAAHRKINPRSEYNVYYQAWVDLNTEPDGDARKAADALRPVIARVADLDKQQAFIDLYVDAMCRLNKPVAAYRELPQPRYSFGKLAEQCRDNPGTLALLVEAHRQRDPKDPWLNFYSAQVDLANEDPQAARTAIVKLKALSATELNKEDSEAVRSWLTWAYYVAGDGLTAYREVPPAEATFDQLADLYCDDQDADGLEKLLAARRADVRGNLGDLPVWEAELQFMRKQYDKVARTLQPIARFSQDIQWRCDDMLVRSLVRLGRIEEAMKAAKASTARDDDPYYEAVVAAAAGDVDAAVKLLDTLLDEWDYDVEVLHDDPDLGPALRTEAFSKFPRLRQPTTASDEE